MNKPNPRDAQSISQADGAAEQTINPSAPTGGTENAFTTKEDPHPSSKGRPTSDTFGEAGDPQGRGNLEFGERTVNPASGSNPTERKRSREGVGNVRGDRDEKESA